jgi:hypothetical protein
MKIPAKEWNAMTEKMEDTSLPHWQEYYKALQVFNERMEEIKPRRELFSREGDFNRAMAEWNMDLSCNAPNKPGYYRANND